MISPPRSSLPGQPIIVLGAGRSGTSYLTSFLQANGVHIGTKLVEQSKINPHGFFENAEIVEFQTRLLARQEPDQGGPLLQTLVSARFTEEDEADAWRILEHTATDGIWGWKDPRTVHFIESWLRLLPHAKLIIPIRHPMEVFYSYIKRIPVDGLFQPEHAFFPAYTQQLGTILSVVRQNKANALVLEARTAFAQPLVLWKEVSQFLDVPNRRAQTVPFYSEEMTRLALSPAVCELFETLYPEASRVFWQLNEVAQIRFIPAEGAPFDEAIRQVLPRIRPSGGNLKPDEWVPFLYQCSIPIGERGVISALTEIIADRIKHVQGLTDAVDDHRKHSEMQQTTIAALNDAVRRQNAVINQQNVHLAELTTACSNYREHVQNLEQAVDHLKVALNSHTPKVEATAATASSVDSSEGAE